MTKILDNNYLHYIPHFGGGLFGGGFSPQLQPPAAPDGQDMVYIAFVIDILLQRRSHVLS